MNFSSLNVAQLRVKLRTLGGVGRVDLEPSQPDLAGPAQRHLGDCLVEQKSDFVLLSKGQSRLLVMAVAVVVTGRSQRPL